MAYSIFSHVFLGHKECELVQYTTVAEAASVSWEEAESCIRGTTSFMSHCLKKGENIALVLKDVGVLLIEGSRVQMKFYYDFLERLCGKENLEEAVFKVRVWGSPWRVGSPTGTTHSCPCVERTWLESWAGPVLDLNSSSTEGLS